MGAHFADGPGKTAPTAPRGKRARAARARRRARGAEPHASDRRRPPRRPGELLPRGVLPGAARGGESRRGADARAHRLAVREGARIAWRFAKARAAAHAAHRLAAALGARTHSRSPRVRIELSPRLWLFAFLGTASIYLLQSDAERVAGGQRWPLLAPWLHSSALPVFAVLAVVVAVLFRAVERWLADYEELAAHAVAFVRRLVSHLPAVTPSRPADLRAPRRLFGLAFESRPPPVPA